MTPDISIGAMTLEVWLAFVIIWFAAGIPLGPNALNCVSVSAAQGFGRALWAVGGILVAAVCYIAAVAFGLSAVLLANEAVFTALKLAGAAYLIWMGLGLLRRAGRPSGAAALGGADPSPRAGGGRWATLRRGFLISLSNPKAMLAYGAVFSQFVSADAAAGPQLAVLAPTALVIVAIIYVGYAALGIVMQRLLARDLWRRRFDGVVGAFYVVAGAMLAADEASRWRVAR